MKRILKVDFHLHSGEDTREKVPYDSFQLVEEAWRKGFDAISITNHDLVTWGDELLQYAESLDILLIPGVEITLEGCHVLVIGADRRLDGVRKLEDLRRVRDGSMLIVAPHPFFPACHGLGRKLPEHLDLFDAIEFCHLYRPPLDFNRPAVRLARASGLPLVAFSDSHALWQFGHNYTLVTAEKRVGSILAAVRAGRVELHARPIGIGRGLRIAWWIACTKLHGLFYSSGPTPGLRWVDPSRCGVAHSTETAAARPELTDIHSRAK